MMNYWASRTKALRVGNFARLLGRDGSWGTRCRALRRPGLKPTGQTSQPCASRALQGGREALESPTIWQICPLSGLARVGRAPGAARHGTETPFTTKAAPLPRCRLASYLLGWTRLALHYSKERCYLLLDRSGSPSWVTSDTASETAGLPNIPEILSDLGAAVGASRGYPYFFYAHWTHHLGRSLISWRRLSS